jgi:hypothetical protein
MHRSDLDSQESDAVDGSGERKGRTTRKGSAPLGSSKHDFNPIFVFNRNKTMTPSNHTTGPTTLDMGKSEHWNSDDPTSETIDTLTTEPHSTLPPATASRTALDDDTDSANASTASRSLRRSKKWLNVAAISGVFMLTLAPLGLSAFGWGSKEKDDGAGPPSLAIADDELKSAAAEFDSRLAVAQLEQPVGKDTPQRSIGLREPTEEGERVRISVLEPDRDIFLHESANDGIEVRVRRYLFGTHSEQIATAVDVEELRLKYPEAFAIYQEHIEKAKELSEPVSVYPAEEVSWHTPGGFLTAATHTSFEKDPDSKTAKDTSSKSKDKVNVAIKAPKNAAKSTAKTKTNKADGNTAKSGKSTSPKEKTKAKSAGDKGSKSGTSPGKPKPTKVAATSKTNDANTQNEKKSKAGATSTLTTAKSPETAKKPRSSDDKAANKKATKKQTAEKQKTEKKSSEESAAMKKTALKKTADKQRADGASGKKETSKKEANKKTKPTAAKQADMMATGKKTADKKTTESKSVGKQISANRSSPQEAAKNKGNKKGMTKKREPAERDSASQKSSMATIESHQNPLTINIDDEPNNLPSTEPHGSSEHALKLNTNSLDGVTTTDPSDATTRRNDEQQAAPPKNTWQTTGRSSLA